MKNIKRRFYFKCALLSLPFAALLALYVIKDPFMVIRHYNDYDNSKVCQSEGTIGWFKYKMFRNIMHYDSFIMGASDTRAFNTHDWNNYIHAHPYRFFANSEGIADVLLKLQTLDRQPHQPIKHLLIVAEYNSFTGTEPDKGFVHIMPPDVTGKSMTTFQMTCMQSFFYPNFLLPYLRYQITHKYVEKMNGVINQYGQTRTRFTNDAILYDEPEIARLGEHYWDAKKWDAAKSCHKMPTEYKRTIFEAQLVCLNKIKDICRKHGTDVKIVIGPTLKRIDINHQDLSIIKKIFGQNNVVNFSDDAHCRYNDYHNFYDLAHYRIQVGRDIMKAAYNN